MTKKDLREKLYSANEYDSLPTPWSAGIWAKIPAILDKDGNVVAILTLKDKDGRELTETELIANVKRILIGNSK